MAGQFWCVAYFSTITLTELMCRRFSGAKTRGRSVFGADKREVPGTGYYGEVGVGHGEGYRVETRWIQQRRRKRRLIADGM